MNQARAFRIELLEPRRLLAAFGPEFVETVGSTVFFTNRDPAHGLELWKTDAGGRQSIVRDVAPGPTSAFRNLDFGVLSRPALVEAGGVVYFFANDGVRGTELWRSDGTDVGTYLVADVVPEDLAFRQGLDYFDTSVDWLTPAGNKVFFNAATGPARRHEVWVSDGTAPGTHRADVPGDANPPASAEPYARPMVSTGSGVLLGAHDGYIWRTDGTTSVRLRAGSLDVSGLGAVELNGALLYVDVVPVGGTYGGELVSRANLGAGEPVALTSFATVAPTSVSQVRRVGNFVFFTARAGTAATDLWRTDGTLVGTAKLATAAAGDSFGDLTAVGGTLYFSSMPVQISLYGGEPIAALWKSDGTPAGTAMIRPLSPTIYLTELAPLTAAGNRLYFRAYDVEAADELWTSDGTATGTVRALDVKPGDALDTSVPVMAGADDGSVYLVETVSTDLRRLRRWQVGANNWPVPHAGGPYRLDRGAPLRVQASRSQDPDGDPLSFSWDLNGDGVFTDAAGATAELSWEAAQVLGLSQPGEWLAAVRADDGQGHTVDSTPVSLSVGDFAPLAYFDGTVTPGTENFVFTITYVDGAGVDVSSVIDNGAAVVVLAPGSSPMEVQYVGIDNPTNGSPRTVTYRIAAPGRKWDGPDNGTYEVRTGSGVRDVQGHAWIGNSLIDNFDVGVRTGLADVAAHLASVSTLRVTGGQRIKAVVEIRNRGDIPMAGPVDVALLLVDALGGKHFAGAALPTLRLTPGSMKRVRVTGVVPTTLDDGMYTLIAEGNGGGVDPNLVNNVDTGPAIEVHRPRLDVALMPPASVAALQRARKARVAFSLRNDADAMRRLGAGVVAVLSRTQDINNPVVRLTAKPIRLTLRPGASKPLALRFVTPRLDPGTYYLLVRIVPTGWEDADEADNLATVAVTVV